MTDHIGEATQKVIDLDALEKLADGATPGPWITETGTETVWVGPSKASAAKVARIICPVDVGPGYITEYVEQQTANAAFIAAANPATIKALIAELKEARAVIDRLASSEAFDVPQAVNGPLAAEMRARMDYARAFLARNGKGEG